MIAYLRRGLAWILPLALLGAGMGSAAATAGSPVATAAGTCSIRGQERNFGPTYVTALSVSGTSCTTGKRVVRAFHRCRKAHGGIKGRCTTPVLGYRCSERRGGIATQFSGRVTCRRGGATVRHTYTQFT